MTRAEFFTLFQTRITGGQLRRGSQTPAEIVAVDGAGQFHALKLGPGLEIIGNEICLSPTTRSPIQLRRNPDGSYDFIGRSQIYRNGLLQLPGVDYTTSGNSVIPVLPWSADDLIGAL